MYLDHFKIDKRPFSLTPNTQFYCELPSHQEALNVLSVSLRSGEGFIKIVGEVGTGKTLLCRLLLDSLGDDFVTAYIPNPELTAEGLRLAVAHELRVDTSGEVDQHRLLDLIHQRLLFLHQQGKRIVLLVDEAQALSEACLEAIRLLTNLETQDSKLLQVVLFGQPELDQKLNLVSLRQLKQRITFSYYLSTIQKNELDAYLCHRLAKAGYTYGSVFTNRAKKLLFRSSGGVPRLLNILCHKSMLVAYGKGETQVTHQAVKRAIVDTESALSASNYWLSTLMWISGGIIGVAGVLFLYWKVGIIP